MEEPVVERKPTLVEKPQDKARNRRLFGNLLLGTLNKIQADVSREEKNELVWFFGIPVFIFLDPEAARSCQDNRRKSTKRQGGSSCKRKREAASTTNRLPRKIDRDYNFD